MKQELLEKRTYSKIFLILLRKCFDIFLLKLKKLNKWAHQYFIVEAHFGCALVDNFDAYSNGNLNGQGDWVGGTDFQVQDSVVQAGAKAVSSGQGTHDMDKEFTAEESGSQIYYVRAAQTTGQGLVSIMGSGISGLTLQCRLNTSGNITLWTTASGEVTVKSGYSADTWYKIEIEWDGTRDGGNGQARVRVNDGAWSNWYDYENAGIVAGGVRIQESAAAAGSFYWDSFSDPNIPTAFATTISEVLNLSETLIKPFGRFVIITETLSMTEAKSRLSSFKKTILETLSLSEIVNRLSIWAKTISETLSLSEIVQALKIVKITITETLNLTDTITRLTQFKKTISETLSLSDVISSIRNVFITISETLNLSDTVARVSKFITTISETLSLTTTLTTARTLWKWAVKNTSTWTWKDKK